MIDYTVRSLREDELEDMLVLTSTAYNSSVDIFRGIYEHDPFYSFDLTRVAEHEGRLIAYLRAAPRTIWVGPATLKMGGIAEVCTLQEYRRMGIATHLLKDIIRLMMSKGYQVSMLYGRSTFYGRVGWEKSSIVQGVRIYRVLIPSYKEANRVRPFRSADLPRVMSLYRSTYRGRSCAMVRDKRHWRGRILRLANLLVYDDGRVRGYMACVSREEKANDGRRRVLSVQEAGCECMEATRGLVGSLAGFEDCEIISHRGVEGDTFLTSLSLPGASISVGWDGMFRVNDAMGTLKGLTNAFRGFDGKLALKVKDDVIEENEDTFIVDSSGGEEVTISRGVAGRNWVELDIRELSQLVPGTFSAMQLASMGKLKYSTRKALALAEDLFPRRLPFQPPLDHF